MVKVNVPLEKLRALQEAAGGETEELVQVKISSRIFNLHTNHKFES
jgi:hypothetical protein